MKVTKLMRAWLAIGFAAVMISCEDDRPRPITPPGAEPAPVSNVQVTATNGGAILRYTLPDAADLSYVLARFEYPAGVVKEFKSSKFTDSLVIEGFGDTKEYDVQLFAVTKSETKSVPVVVKVQPLKPIAQVVSESIGMLAAFGGVEVKFDDNARRDPLAIHVIKRVDDSWEEIDVNFFETVSGSFKSRGQQPVPIEFGVYVRDRWNNYSDTIVQVLTPFEEVRITGVEGSYALAGDYNRHYTGTYAWILDNNLQNSLGTLVAENVTLPLSMTMAFDDSYKFSRMKFFMPYLIEYDQGSVENFEVYGSNELVDDWSKWTKIMDCKVEKPSGLPLGSVTSADYEHARRGIDFDFPLDAPPYKYLRFKMLNTFDYVNFYRITELQFWGSSSEVE